MRVEATRRSGDQIVVMGMVGRDANGDVVSGADAQARRALERVEEALAPHGLDRRALTRLRVYLTNIDDWPGVRDEITAYIGETWPPAIVIAVAALIEPSMCVEIEADATT